MTKREWENRWRGKLATLDLRTSSPYVCNQTGVYYYVRGVDGEFAIVSKWYDTPKKSWVKIHRKDIIRFTER